ncbi:hypothetical protein ZWY2020_035886 [Hordeum vulgare]|nr:hypothetical protein ZWY2020_035886 [Hordeum vulgare]
MTYDRLVSRPGPRLNLVVGPNGSGKSSLVCAIALALATDPSILGRASSVRAFVKRGEESDHVRLSLRSQSQASDIHITRKVDTNNKSEWLLDGTSVPKKDIIDVIKKFNIQINNLTQFLPQDRVCEFAKLTPIQLLEETEKAVGDPNLPVQHRQLIERSRELRNIEVLASRVTPRRASRRLRSFAGAIPALPESQGEPEVRRSCGARTPTVLSHFPSRGQWLPSGTSRPSSRSPSPSLMPCFKRVITIHDGELMR